MLILSAQSICNRVLGATEAHTGKQSHVKSYLAKQSRSGEGKHLAPIGHGMCSTTQRKGHPYLNSEQWSACRVHSPMCNTKTICTVAIVFDVDSCTLCRMLCLQASRGEIADFLPSAALKRLHSVALRRSIVSCSCVKR